MFSSATIRPAAPLLTLLILLIPTSSARSAPLWPTDSTSALPVCWMPGFVQQPQMISDGANGLIAIWSDYRKGLSDADIYARHIDSNGDTLWNGNGNPVCASSGNQNLPSSVSDGKGGLITAWADDGQFGIYAQRLNASGAQMWVAPGKVVSMAYSSSNGPLVCSDSTGGAFVTFAPGTGAVLGQHVDSLGTRWTFFPPTVQGVTLRSTGAAPRAIVPDGAGGAIVAIGATSGSNNVVCVQRYDAARSVLWGANGVDLCANPSAVIYSMVPDGAGGVIVAWEDRRNGPSNSDIFVQRVSASGTPLWTANGVPVCTESHVQTHPSLRALSDGGAVVAWSDQRISLAGELYAQRLDPTGAPQWTPDGVPVATGILQAQAFSAVAGSGDNTFVCWNSTTLGGGDVFAQQLDGNGNRLFGPAGVAVCRGPNGQTQSSFLADGSGGVYAAFDDQRNVDDDIYAQHLRANGMVGQDVLAVPNAGLTVPLRFECSPNPWVGQLRIQLAGEISEPGRIDIFDISGRRVWGTRLERGTAALIWNGQDNRGKRAGPGVYRVRIVRGAVTGVIAVVRVQ